ncbi:MAG: hypothetical protein Q4B16_04700 [Bacteroidia bacterium]|nr:hypothetical protein [Bacteroidia bacterium]
MDRTLYLQKLDRIFRRFPSVQKCGFAKDSYKPGLEHMQAFSKLLGRPQARLRTIHVAGTNGKGSVASMLAAALSEPGLRVGLYTSPHILDFRERMRIISPQRPALSPGCPQSRDFISPPQRPEFISEEEVMSFLEDYESDFISLDLSFFEITTGMAFRWFADRGVDCAVIETGLGGRLDSTNIITPLISVVTGIGLDHCELLGDTRAKIAAEKAGIFKPGVPALVSVRDEETAAVFEKAASRVGAPLHFADEMDARGEAWRTETLSAMDLRGDCQKENLRTVCAALQLLRPEATERDWNAMRSAIERTAAITDFHGRWEALSRDPLVICDIAHNPPALKVNFATLGRMLAEGECDVLIIVYGVMADKDLGAILPLMPREAEYVLVEPRSARSMKVAQLYRRVLDFFSAADSASPLSGVTATPEACSAASASGGASSETDSAASEPGGTAPLLCPVTAAGSVEEGVRAALARAEALRSRGRRPLIYIGGSTFVVAEAVGLFKKGDTQDCTSPRN